MLPSGGERGGAERESLFRAMPPLTDIILNVKRSPPELRSSGPRWWLPSDPPDARIQPGLWSPMMMPQP
jgi:hypothetical protein